MKRSWYHGSAKLPHLTEAIWRPLTKASAARSSVLFIVVFLLLVGAIVTTRLLGTASEPENASPKPMLNSKASQTRPKNEYPLNCTFSNLTGSCPRNYPTSHPAQMDPDPPSQCPEYFRWIYEDLRPWLVTGITRDMLERAKRTANFRLVILNGRAYVERYEKAFQTRDVFTLWGILQLLRRYPGQLPDLELMFDCVDWPIVRLRNYARPNAPSPPPLFRYCGDDSTLDIVFPDWSFWGWPDINIKPWDALLKDLQEGNRRSRWMEREPYAYWKGNPAVATTRMDLLKCNVSEKQDWNARLYGQDWLRELNEGYKQSDLASQCTHRYKIYIEGSAWSVSEKYILACDSVTLLVKPHYYDFFTRSLMPVHHYWPIRDDDKCRSIKFAVEWGNNHKQKAQAIGKAASRFAQEELKMEYVYDYMFHLLGSYAKLLRFKPALPPKAVEVCSETMACSTIGLEKKFMEESLVKGPADAKPCTMLPPYDPPELQGLIRKKENAIKQVELWEQQY